MAMLPPASPEDDVLIPPTIPRPLPHWLHPGYSKQIVKGNFMMLSEYPKTVERGEWMAHQAVEQFRNLWHFVRVVYDKEDDGLSICNEHTCPKMSAGSNHSYTWLNSQYKPTELPAHRYMALMQRWISSRIDNTSMFPTDPNTVSFSLKPDSPSMAHMEQEKWAGERSGFPADFEQTCKTTFSQMFRVYAHLYWAHFVDPFYHLNLEKQLNSCFAHFLLVALNLDMLRPEELEPMQLLIDLWAVNGTFPPDSAPFGLANLRRGNYILTYGPDICAAD
ncbi:Maintenance of ploidy protein mob2 [Ceratocystis fimbriata CBS 114723]|uniref:Maintenance of ploidy protein mob2 n=1 Tax=Ceratocystis fimbriata CBS 114723 TaxID=1035309 RepID=A0A2C5X584_9PEZI|nr:Maintenance of ploidy protein mob2 [Ceratocystis fimbriata CBS 114723]